MVILLNTEFFKYLYKNDNKFNYETPTKMFAHHNNILIFTTNYYN